MKTRLMVIMILTLPLFINAQSFNPSQFRPTIGAFPMEKKNPELPPKMPTMKPLNRSRIENMQVKLAKEERKLTKLAKKAWKHEVDLKKKQENLTKLENVVESNNDFNHQKKIETAKKQLTKSQDKLNKAKKDLELNLKKVEDLEKKIEKAKFTRQE